MQMLVCPYCYKEDVHPDASKCPHCGSDVGNRGGLAVKIIWGLIALVVLWFFLAS